MPSNLPLVSAIMPTRGRQVWAQQALEMFRAQTYPNTEMVIIDDASEPSFIIPPHGVVYERAPQMTIGAKRNVACSRASGTIICHWDSDDRYMPERIASQVRQLLDSDVDLVGYCALEFEEADGPRRRWEFRSSDPNCCVGVSMMYWRDSWEERPFTTENVGEDTSFMLTRSHRGFEPEGLIIGRIHNGNTSDKRADFGKSAWRQIA